MEKEFEEVRAIRGRRRIRALRGPRHQLCVDTAAHGRMHFGPAEGKRLRSITEYEPDAGLEERRPERNQHILGFQDH
jgi:hypothetical protein